MKRQVIALAIALSALTACETAPVTGRSQLIVVPEAQVAQMGLQTFQEILKKEDVSKDPKLNATVQTVGSRVAQVVDPGTKWEFVVFNDDKQVNAFALPGGKVGVYSGLFKVVNSEAELAAVIGHEIAHVTARHGAERLSQGIVAQAGLAATSLALSNRDPTTVQLVTTALGAGATVGVLLPYSRLQESEADKLGMVYMAKAGYDPRAAKELWLKMAKAAQGQARPPELLSTHPANETRIAQIDKWMPEALSHYKGGKQTSR
ncbi:MAG TPA: M48 family metallopeptidase [Burkholderiales bacterium]|nr:M48 family metallopeptidase [Burkholderiales bacterium]